jgi:hypothetical protein
MLSLQPAEFQRLEDARWARQDPDVMVQYLGEFVVPYQRKIVAHGRDAAVVLAEAAQITGRPPEELPLVGVVDPLLDMPRLEAGLCSRGILQRSSRAALRVSASSMTNRSWLPERISIVAELLQAPNETTGAVTEP